MAFSKSQHELLSGYLDNQLDVAELREVQELLQNPIAQEYLQSLQDNRLALQRLAQSLHSQLPANFAQRVLSAAGQLHSAESTIVLPMPTPESPERPWSQWATLAGLAATLIFAVSSSIWYRQGLGPQDLVSNDKLPDDSPQIADNDLGGSEEPVETRGGLVRRQDLQVHYLLTMDVEIAPGVSFASSIGQLLGDFGIGIAKSAKMNEDISKALDEVRVTAVPGELGSASEVYLVRAPSQALSDMIDEISADSVRYPQLRFGLAFEAPNDPLLNKLSGNAAPDSRILLGQAMADALGAAVEASEPFAAPLMDKDQSTSFPAIPSQGELLVSSNRHRGSAFSAGVLPSDSQDQHSFLLLFVRRN